MKIICIGQNYANHNKEMSTATPSEPVFFMKPDTALIINNKPFYYPDFTKELHHEIEIVLKISKNGKNIDPVFTNEYFEEIGLGIDFTARDLQAKCKEKGGPWEKAKSFDGSAPVGRFISKKQIQDISAINFHLNINGKTIQNGNTKELLFSFGTVISFVSRFVTLRKGDLIFTGTPEGVGPVKIGDRLDGFLENQKLLSVEVR